MQNNQNATVGDQVISSTLWVGSWRWSARVIGFVTTIILARLLVPEDFGILAAGAVVASFFGIITRLGGDTYLIRHKDPTREDFDTAWTIQVIVVSIASAGIFFAAQPGADYFNDQRLADVLRILAVAGWLSAFTNIGLTMYRRDLQFRKIALIGISQRLASTFTTIAMAVLLRNYWAMVIGEIVFGLVGLILSYVQHEYRPRFNLVKFADQWDFSKWIVVQNIASFLGGQGDNFVIVKFFGIEIMGYYSMGMRFAALPTRQLLAPALQPIFSGLAKKQHDEAEFVVSVLKVIGATAILMLPAATLVASLSEEIITTLLGEQWLQAIPLVEALTLSIMLGMLTSPAGSVLTIKGKMRLLAIMSWLSAIFVLAVIVVAAQWQQIEVLIWARVGATLVLFALYYVFMVRALEISAFTILGVLYRPVFASIVMALLVYLISSAIASDWIAMFVSGAIGGASYLLIVFTLWRLAGSPDSGESMLVRKLFRLVARRSS